MEILRLDKIQKLLNNEKEEFKNRYGLKLTTLMISIVSEIPKYTIDNFKNFKDDSLEKYYKKLKQSDFSRYINKKMFR